MGGWFVDVFSWRWIFYINIPLGAVAVIVFAASFKPSGERVAHKIDWLGAASLSVALASLTLLTTLGGRTFDWASPQIIGLTALSLASLVTFIMAEQRAEEPILPLALFKMNVFTVTSIIGFITGAAMFGTITFIPLYLQIAKGTTPTISGLLLIPMTIGIVLSSTTSGRWMSKTGRYRILPVIGMFVLAIGLVLLSWLEPDTPIWQFSIYLWTVGFGVGFVFPVVTTSVQNTVPRENLGTATAAGIMFRQIGGSMGVAVFGSLFAARMASGLGDSVMGGGTLEIGPQFMDSLPPEMRDMIAQAVVTALRPIYLTAAALAVLGVAVSFALKEVPLQGQGTTKSE